MTFRLTAGVLSSHRLWALLFLLFFLNLPLQVFSENSPSEAVVLDLWVDPTSDKNGFIVSLFLSAPAQFQASTEANPPRLIIDLPNTSISSSLVLKTKKKTSSSPSTFTLTDYKSLILPQKQNRLIFTFSKPFVLRSTDNLQGQNGTTLLITLAEESVVETPALILQKSALPHTPLTPQKRRKPLIVLDPGHGGEDPGAETKSGTQEKHIVLKVAQNLKEVLESSNIMDVALTRSEDIFIPLSARVGIAREMGATLFISLHADALPSTSSVNGLTIYTLSPIASDKESARLAEHENISASLGKVPAQEGTEEVDNILMDFVARETRMLSISFSEKLIEHWRGELSLNKSPLRSANFLVLKAPDIPSVLIELAYLSNIEDIKRLSSDQWQKQFIAGVERAVRSFLEDKRQLEHMG